MNIYKVTFSTKDVMIGFSAVVSRWQIVIAESAAEAIEKIERNYSNIHGNMEIEKRNN